LDAAAELIAEQGSTTRASLAMIGERAGFSRGIVNHHFGSKAELLRRLVVRAQKNFAQHYSDAGASGLVSLIQLAELYLRSTIPGNAASRALMMMWVQSVGDAELREIFVDGDRRFRAGIQRMIVAGIADGSIRPDINPRAHAAALVGQFRGITIEALVDPKAVQRSAVIAAVKASLEALRPA
jgi:AcrR family transcriptional regulator